MGEWKTEVIKPRLSGGRKKFYFSMEKLCPFPHSHSIVWDCVILPCGGSLYNDLYACIETKCTLSCPMAGLSQFSILALLWILLVD